MPAQLLMLLAALLANLIRYGLRLDPIKWPLPAVLCLRWQSLLLADVDPALTPVALLGPALSLALPCCLLLHLGRRPGSREH